MLNLIPLAEATPTGFDFSGILMIIILIAIFYFLMIRPQQKQQKKIRQFRESLTKGDKVVTAGGIHGTIREVRPDMFIVEVDEGVKLSVDRGSVYPSASDANQAQQSQEQPK